MVAGGQGSEPLDVDAQEGGEGRCLGLAQLRELLGHVVHRAVPLADLDAGQGAGTDRSGRGGETVEGEGLDQGVSAGGRVVPDAADLVAVALHDRLGPGRGEGVHTSGARLVEEAQHLGGEVGIPRREHLMTGVGDDIRAGWSAGTTLGGAGRIVLLDGALSDEGVEVAPHAGGGQGELVGDRRGGDRPKGRDQGQDALARPVLEGHSRRGIHNSYVT